MADFVGRAAVDQVADEPVLVGGHGNEVDGVGFCELDDLGGGFAHGKNAFHFKSLLPEFFCRALKVGAVLRNLLSLCRLELLEIPGHPTVGNMQEEKLVRRDGLLYDGLTSEGKTVKKASIPA